MKKIFFASLILLIVSSSLYAGEIYTYKDKNGNTVISNTPIPEKYEKKAKKIEAYKRDSPAVIERYQAEQAAIERRNIEEYKRKRQINEAKAASRQAQNSETQPQVSRDEQTKSQIKRKEQMEKTDQLSKDYWAEVERCRRNKCKVNKNLRDEYHKAVDEDPRSIKTTITTKRSKR